MHFVYSLSRYRIGLRSLAKSAQNPAFETDATEQQAHGKDSGGRFQLTSPPDLEPRSSFCTIPVGSGPSPQYGDAVSIALRLLRQDVQSLGSMDPQAVLDLLWDALKDSSGRLGSERATIVCLLQDISGDSGKLPRCVQLPSITDRKFVNSGSEASIWSGRLGGKLVVARQAAIPTVGEDWNSLEGNLTLKAVRREVITLLQIQHPNIVPFLGTVSDSHHPLAIISPYYSFGHALLYFKKLQRSARPTALLNTSRSIASALRYLHTRNPPVIHGDIHARNIVIDDDGNALLIDFGLARIKHEVTRSTTGLIEGGKYRYLAPELLAVTGPNDFRTSPATDCYAFAMTILEMATLDRPYAEFTHEIRAAHAAERGIRPARPKDLGCLTTDSANALWGLLESMWAQSASHRPSLSHVQFRIQEIQDSLLV